MLTFESYLFEIVNLVLLVIYTKLILRYTHQRRIVFLAFLFHILLIFCFNGVLFDPYYFPDQFGYLYATNYLRGFDYESAVAYGLTVAWAGLFFAIVPLISYSVLSISSMSYFYYLLIFLFVYRKLSINTQILSFFIFYPSLLLYTSIGLRETIVLLLMILSIYYLIKEKYIVCALSSSFLFFLKTQNFLIFILASVIWFFTKKRLGLKNFLILVLTIIGLAMFASELISIENLNFYRLAFAAEDYIDITEIDYIEGWRGLILKAFFGIFKFAFMPLPWESRNFLQFIQSIENIVIAILFLLAVKSYIKLHVKDDVIRFLFLHTLIGFAVYGIIIFNYGTAARYRFPYITVFFLFFYHRIEEIRRRSKEETRVQIPMSDK